MSNSSNSSRVFNFRSLFLKWTILCLTLVCSEKHVPLRAFLGWVLFSVSGFSKALVSEVSKSSTDTAMNGFPTLYKIAFNNHRFCVVVVSIFLFPPPLFYLFIFPDHYLAPDDNTGMTEGFRLC